MLKILELHSAGFEQQFGELSSAHCACDVKRSVVIQVEGVNVALGGDEDSNDASVSISAGGVQWRVAVIIVN